MYLYQLFIFEVVGGEMLGTRTVIVFFLMATMHLAKGDTQK